MPNCRAQERADGLPLSRQVSQYNTNRLIMRLSSLLRQGRGGWYLSLARAFARFSIEASYGSLRDSGLYSDGMPRDFVSFRDNLDFSTPSGRLMFQIIGAMAEFERALIQERVKAGMRNARAKGRKIGRPPQTPLSPELRSTIANAYQFGGTSLRLLARKFGTSLATVQRCVRVSRMRDGDDFAGPAQNELEPPTR
jgi:Resolvase, N terminal domain